MALGRPLARTLAPRSRHERSLTIPIGNGALVCALILVAFLPVLGPIALAGPREIEFESLVVLVVVLATGCLRARWPLVAADHDAELDSALGRAYAIALTGTAVAILLSPSFLALDPELGHQVRWLAIPPFAAACVANCYGMRGLRSFRAPLVASVIAFPPLIQAFGIGPTHSWIVIGTVVGFGSIGPAIRTSGQPTSGANEGRRSTVLGAISAMVVAFLLVSG